MASESFSKVPLSTIAWQRRSYSSAEPSHQWIESGPVRAANRSTQAISFLFLVRASAEAVLSVKGRINSSFSFTERQTPGKATPDVGPIVSHPAGRRRQLPSEPAKLILMPCSQSAPRQARFAAPEMSNPTN